MASESESEKHETLAYIVAWLRDPKIKSPMRKTWRDVLADRIEATWKREMTEAEANALAVGGLVEAERQRVVVSKTETTTVGNAREIVRMAHIFTGCQRDERVKQEGA